jgi:hypothetical protein
MRAVVYQSWLEGNIEPGWKALSKLVGKNIESGWKGSSNLAGNLIEAGWKKHRTWLEIIAL